MPTRKNQYKLNAFTRRHTLWNLESEEHSARKYASPTDNGESRKNLNEGQIGSERTVGVQKKTRPRPVVLGNVHELDLSHNPKVPTILN